MTQDLTPHFSGKVLLLSVIFLLANLGVYGVKNGASDEAVFTSAIPRLISANPQNVEIKSLYDTVYRPAEANQEIDPDTFIKTGEKEFAELVVGNDVIRLDQQTEIRVINNASFGFNAYSSQVPTLELELLSGGISVKAFDLIEIHSKRSIVNLNHGVGILSYVNTLTKLMVVTGDAHVRFLDEGGRGFGEFFVPLNNQVTFADSQITEAYASLKPSKWKKELKMMPIPADLLTDDWVVRNANDFGTEKASHSLSLIDSESIYKIKAGYQKLLSYFTFTSEARQNLIIKEAKTMLGYLLGGIQTRGDLTRADEIMQEFEGLLNIGQSDPILHELVTQTLFDTEFSAFGSPAYKLKEFLVDQVVKKEGPVVLRLYLEDLRRALLQNDLKNSEAIAKKWVVKWSPDFLKENASEYDRQSQILNHTILAYISIVPASILDIFDQTGAGKMTYSGDVEEARFEVASDRLQIASSLISSYRYSVAKDYLKKSYLSLGIEKLNPELDSTKIFLESSNFLAERIDYAENILHGAAKPIDETDFLNYSLTLKRNASLSEDLRKFFELDKQASDVSTQMQAPTADQVASRFLDARINVNYSDISLRPDSGFYYDVKNARLIDRGSKNETFSFDATYDYTSNSVTDVVTEGKSYQGSFTLPDIVTVLKQGISLGPKIPTPKTQDDIASLITDQEKTSALEGQAIAQDVARQVAYNRLIAFGISIPDANFDIEILDTVNLNFFHVKNALISRQDGDGITIAFDYHSASGEIDQVVGKEGVILIEKIDAKDLSSEVLKKTLELEKQLQVVSQFNLFIKQNQLFIDPKNIVYTSASLLSLTDLELTTLGLKVSGLYDPETSKFVFVNHTLFSAKDIDVKDYFNQLANLYIISFMQAHGFSLKTDQLQSTYPFSKIFINQLMVGSTLFSFNLDITGLRALNVKSSTSPQVISVMPLDDLLK